MYPSVVDNNGDVMIMPGCDRLVPRTDHPISYAHKGLPKFLHCNGFAVQGWIGYVVLGLVTRNCVLMCQRVDTISILLAEADSTCNQIGH